MLLVAITGGVATGKSTAAKWISDALGCELFSADAAVADLLASDAEVQREIVSAFGSQVLNANLEVDRGKLRGIVFNNEGDRHRLESILHPRVRQTWLGRANDLKRQNIAGCFLAEIPLLFETGGDAYCDRVITVACSLEMQLFRLTTRRGIAREIGTRIIAAQAALDEKVLRSNYMIWNDSDQSEPLAAQCDLIAAHLRNSL